MYNIYVPFDDLSIYNSFSISDDGNIIYAFKNEPIMNEINNVDVIYINNHYSVINSNVEFDNLNYINQENITNNWLYRKDLTDIFICLFFMILFFFGIPIFIISRIFKRRW